MRLHFRQLSLKKLRTVVAVGAYKFGKEAANFRFLLIKIVAMPVNRGLKILQSCQIRTVYRHKRGNSLKFIL